MESIGMMTRTHHYRKVMKPLLERKRRARINKCLDEIKDLVLECMEQQGDNIAKLEKADVLELAVNHLRKLRQTSSQQPSSAHSFRLGFVHAANEVSRALASSPKVDVNLGTKLMTHLGHRLNEIQAQQEMEKRTSLVAVTPLTVVCSENYHQSQLSPASSGYGSDLECSSSTKGLLQLADDASEAEKNIWRPW